MSLSAQQSSCVNEMHIHSGANVAVYGDLENIDSTLYNDGHLSLIGDSLINKAPIQGSGTLELSGNADQHITHEGIIIVDSLILNNTLDISFNNDIFINKHLGFRNGLLYDYNDGTIHPDSMPTVTFGAQATYDSLLADDMNHIDGMVKKMGKTRFVFPIGDDGYYAPVAVDGIDTATTVTARYYYEWIPELDQVEYGVELYHDEYWYVSGGDKSYDITLSYDDRRSTFDPSEGGIKVVGYNKNEGDITYRINDAEPTSIMSYLSYKTKNALLDTSNVYYGFGREDSLIQAEDLFVPQILSLNGDGINDVFVIKGLSSYPDNKLIIFNRYGDVLYEQEHYDNTWRGTTNRNVFLGGDDNTLNTGTYFVLLFNKDKCVYKDFIEIIRSE